MESEFSDSPALRARISQFHGCTSSRISRGLGSDGHRMGIRRHSMDLPVDGIQERHRRDVEDRRRPDICDIFHDLGSRDPFRSEVDRRQRSGDGMRWNIDPAMRCQFRNPHRRIVQLSGNLRRAMLARNTAHSEKPVRQPSPKRTVAVPETNPVSKR